MAVVQTGSALPESFLRCEVFHQDGAKRTIADVMAGEPTLFVFLRHFGCIGCSEALADLLPRIGELRRIGLRVILIGNGAPRFIEKFVQRYNLSQRDVVVVTDPELDTFRALGMRRSIWSTVGPRSAWDVIRGLLTGHSQTSVEGDALQQGGVVLAGGDGRVVYSYRNRSIGDHAPASDIIDASLRLVAESADVAV